MTSEELREYMCLKINEIFEEQRRASELIRKQDAVSAVYDRHRFPSRWDVYDYLKELPAIEPKYAEWVGEADGYWDGELVYDMWYCSNCDYKVDNEKEPDWNYCPNCGAKMR